MGVKFGEIDSGQIIENEYRIMVLEKIVETLARKMPITGSALSEKEVTQIRTETVEQLQKKYPNSGISLKKED